MSEEVKKSLEERCIGEDEKALFQKPSLDHYLCLLSRSYTAAEAIRYKACHKCPYLTYLTRQKIPDLGPRPVKDGYYITCSYLRNMPPKPS